MKFSIGIPAFKSRFLKENIDNILKQTFSDFELIIVNDASPEDIDSIVNGYNDKRIRYYKNETNFGAVNVVDNWNKCLSLAKGEFFLLMGDDDKLMPNCLEEYDKLIKKYPKCNLFHTRTIIINEDSQPINITEPRPEWESVYDNIFQRISGNRLQFISDYLYRTDALRKNGGFYKLPLAWASDDISAYINAGTMGVAHCQTPLFCYRKNSQTITSTGNIKIKLQAVYLENKWLKDFVEKSKPTNVLDELILEKIKKQIDKYIGTKIAIHLSQMTYPKFISTVIKMLYRNGVMNISCYYMVYGFLLKLKN